LLPMALLIAVIIIVPPKVQRAMLSEKYVTMTQMVDVIAAGVEAEPTRTWHEHEVNIKKSVEQMDGIYEVYAAAYKTSDGETMLFTERHFEASIFEPFDYDEFCEAVESLESGAVTINYAPEGKVQRDLYIYFRWMPLYSPRGERYLVVMGVSRHSIVTKDYLWVTYALWAVFAISTVGTVFTTYLTACLGHIYTMRKGKSKWRERWDPKSV